MCILVELVVEFQVLDELMFLVGDGVFCYVGVFQLIGWMELVE